MIPDKISLRLFETSLACIFIYFKVVAGCVFLVMSSMSTSVIEFC